MDQIILLYSFILPFLGLQKGLAARSGPMGLLRGFCVPTSGPFPLLHLQPLTFSVRALCLLQPLHPWALFLISTSIFPLAPSP